MAVMGARENVVARSIAVSIGTLVCSMTGVDTCMMVFFLLENGKVLACATTSNHVFKFIS